MINAMSGSSNTALSADLRRSMLSGSGSTNRSRPLVPRSRPCAAMANPPKTAYRTPARSSAASAVKTSSRVTSPGYAPPPRSIAGGAAPRSTPSHGLVGQIGRRRGRVIHPGVLHGSGTEHHDVLGLQARPANPSHLDPCSVGTTSAALTTGPPKSARATSPADDRQAGIQERRRSSGGRIRETVRTDRKGDGGTSPHRGAHDPDSPCGARHRGRRLSAPARPSRGPAGW